MSGFYAGRKFKQVNFQSFNRERFTGRGKQKRLPVLILLSKFSNFGKKLKK